MQSSSKHILIVDDDRNIRMLLQFILKRDYQVTVKENGLEALAWLAHGHQPDVIIADLEMPEVNGLDMLQQIRTSGAFRHMPVVILSAHEHPHYKEKCLAYGASAYLLKPFNPQTVMAALENAKQAAVSFH